MKVLVPLTELRGTDSRISDHFGRASYYALIRLEGDKVSIDYLENPRARGIRPGEFFSELGIDYVVIKGGIGARALNILRSVGTEVLTTEANTLAEVIDEIRRGTLRRFEGTPCGGRGNV